MSEDPKPRRGRPSVRGDDPEPPISVHVKLPAREYDEHRRRASEAGVSVPEHIRRALLRREP